MLEPDSSLCVTFLTAIIKAGVAWESNRKPAEPVKRIPNSAGEKRSIQQAFLLLFSFSLRSFLSHSFFF